MFLYTRIRLKRQLTRSVVPVVLVLGLPLCRGRRPEQVMQLLNP